MIDVINLTQQLIAQASITPDDAQCQAILAELLNSIGFEVHSMPCENVNNLWALYGDTSPLFVFAGHSDVVPAGDLQQWKFDPFTPTLHDGKLYGRGAADMKGGLAAMVAATAQFLKQSPTFKGSIGFLITSGEEGDYFQHGTPYVMERLAQQGINIDYCIVGEPSSNTTLGDTIKIGRRGSLSGSLTVIGKQGHIAYPHLAINPIHGAASVIAKLCSIKWDEGNEFFPATSFQISNLHSGTGTKNVIPGETSIEFNFRFGTATDPQSLQQRVQQILDDCKVEYNLTWRLNGMPFLTPAGFLIETVQQLITTTTGNTPELSTGGGTSDGRFIAPFGVDVIELGLVNDTIHQVNECVTVADVVMLEKMYLGILQRVFR